MEGPGFNLSVEKRILLHLLKYSQAYIDEWEVPHALSQEGISEALEILLNNVSRAMKKLKEEGKVKERLAHIKGVKRRRKAYFLDEEGVKLAEEIRAGLQDRKIPYMNKEGEKKDLAVMRIVAQVRLDHGKTIGATDVVEEFRRKEVFDAAKYIASIESRKEQKRTSKAFVDLTDNAPRLGSFVGREGEVARIEQCIEGPGPPIIVVHGMAGIGKTSVALKVLEDLRGQRHIYYHRFHSWDSIQNLASSLQDLLSRIGISKMGDLDNVEVNDLAALLGRGLSNKPVVLVFDDFHKARKEVLPLFRILTDLSPQFKELRVLVVGRGTPKFYGRRDVTVNRVVEEIHLDGLGKDEVRALLGEDYGDEALERIYRLSRGVPLFLEILGSVDNVDAIGDVQRYVEEEIYSELEAGQRGVLQNLSVHRYPVPPEAVLLGGAVFDDLSELCSKSVVIELPHRRFEAHDLVKEFVYDRMSPGTKLECHRAAAGFYQGSSDDPDPFDGLYYSPDLAKLEAVHHLQKGELPKEAARLLLKVGPDLFRRGYTEVKDLLDDIEISDVDPEMWAGVLLLKGDAMVAEEDWASALMFYQEALERKKAIGADRGTLAAIHGMIGKIQMRVQRWEETIRSHKDALTIYEEAGDPRGMARELINLGLVYRNQRDWKKAEASYAKARRMLEDLEDISGLVVLHNNLAHLRMGQGDLRKAEGHIRKGLEYAKQAEDQLGKAVVLFTRGDIMNAKGRIKEARRDLESSAELFRGKGELGSAIKVYLRLGDVLQEAGMTDRSMKAFLKALDIYQFMRGSGVSIFRRRRGTEDSHLLGTIYDRLSMASRERGDLEGALAYDEKAMASYDDDDDPIMTARKLLDMGLVHEEQGHYKESIRNMDRALDILRGAEDLKGEAVIMLNLARVWKARGNLKRARRHLEDVIAISDRLGDKELGKVARDASRKGKGKRT
jgi:tetratricopeptide (TPR) repeat protein